MTTPKCVDLRELPAASGYRLFCESDGTPAGKRTDPWEVVARGRRGEIGPYDDRRLLVSTNGPGITRLLLAAIPGAEVSQDAGSDGANVIVPVAAFAQAAAVIKPRRKRRVAMSEARRMELAERMRRLRKAG
jgi:hypothetical protein